MGKKRTPGRRREIVDHSGDYDNRTEGKIDAINTWNDIEHDDEDQFHEDREKVLLGYEKQMRGDDDDSEMSEQEVYGLEGVDSDDEEDQNDYQSDDDDEKDDEEEKESESWGQSKKSYYDADEGSDLEEMREEEQEAIRLQKKRIEAMDEEDFVEAGWGGVSLEKDDDEDRKLVESVNKDLEDITFSKYVYHFAPHASDIESARISKRLRTNMPTTEVLKILQNESPELVELLSEFKDRLSTIKELAPVITTTQSSYSSICSLQQVTDSKNKAVEFFKFKYHLILNYLTNIAFYLCLKASGASNIRDHPVIGSLVELRTSIEKAEAIEKKLNMEKQISHVTKQLEELHTAPKKAVNKNGKTNGKAPKKTAKPVEIAEELPEESEDESEIEDDHIDVPMIEEEFKSMKKANKKRKRPIANDDFQDLDALDTVDIEDKAAKKRSLRDYVAKIDTKQQRKSAKYQGDSDIPYKDRAKRDQKGVAQPQDNSADLDDADWDDTDVQRAQGNAEDENDDLYEQVKAKKAALKESKKADYEATRMPIIADADLADGDKRSVTWQILKNRGLTPHRKKENRNSRVKHRSKYEKKMKNLSSFRAVAKTQDGAYGGEKTGIRTGLARSVKLA
ncbi:hypothetical protein INT44_003196 [Umbelopsis vinacea]|uniref:Sas10 C-terminal domain-containing protein n=1 Tax=Umbelopsis vinacea TaxID=44442 RepID=A0A8H7UP75_9FUNG|nr:hypothetical protein INT44_003196 [Umbelopsis vinacea]